MARKVEYEAQDALINQSHGAWAANARRSRSVGVVRRSRFIVCSEAVVRIHDFDFKVSWTFASPHASDDVDAAVE